MSQACRLEGLEPDNLLAFMALLGTLRALEHQDASLPERERLRPRAGWETERLPLRPSLYLSRPLAQLELAEAIATGTTFLAEKFDFGASKDLTYTYGQSRALLDEQARKASINSHQFVDLLSALMTDAATRVRRNELVIEPTPLCLMFGQGHQHFLERLASVPRQPAPRRPTRRKQEEYSAAQCIADALFAPWHRTDATFSFRWDPEEDVRYALLPGDPTAPAYKGGTQHGANRLAAIGLASLTMTPARRRGRVHPSVIGGAQDASGFSIAWPIWREPATLASVRSLLAHPDLRQPAGLNHLGVEQVMVAKRISVGKYVNFTRARPAAS